VSDAEDRAVVVPIRLLEDKLKQGFEAERIRIGKLDLDAPWRAGESDLVAPLMLAVWHALPSYDPTPLAGMFW